MTKHNVAPAAVAAWGVSDETLDHIYEVSTLCHRGWKMCVMSKPEIADKIDSEFANKREAIICAMSTAHLMSC